MGKQRYREGEAGTTNPDDLATGTPGSVEARDRKLATCLSDLDDILRSILSYPDVSGELAKDVIAARDLLAKHVPSDLAGKQESRRPRDSKEWLEQIERRAAKRR